MKKYLTILFLLFYSCHLWAQKDTIKYFFAGHTYKWFTPGNKVDERLELIDFGQYEGVWLGGDVCSEALLEYETLEYIDALFDLKHPNTHWAMGNHDARNGNWNWLQELQGRKTYYTSSYKGISYMVLNTNLTPYDCEQLDDQYRTIKYLCDTIQNSSHLIFLMHHGIWHDIPGLPNPIAYAQSSLTYYSFNCYNKNSTFSNEIYPMLKEVKARGIEVILILGDMGSKMVEFTSDDGIHFLGTGLNRSKYPDPEELATMPKDWIIEFKHVPEERKLEWEFIDLDIMVEGK